MQRQSLAHARRDRSLRSRLRGILRVVFPAAGSPSPEPPLYLRLGLDLDAERPAPAELPARPPSAARGAGLDANLPVEFLNRDYYLSHSPAELWSSLRRDSSLARFNDQELWDVVALTWSKQATPADLSVAARSYAENCAACHGERGSGDGVFAGDLAPPTAEAHTDMPAGEMTAAPADFSDPARILSASPALLYGKILRGGMGTGMPYWGPIFTEQQIWDLVAYLYTFQLEQEP